MSARSLCTKPSSSGQGNAPGTAHRRGSGIRCPFAAVPESLLPSPGRHFSGTFSPEFGLTGALPGPIISTLPWCDNTVLSKATQSGSEHRSLLWPANSPPWQTCADPLLRACRRPAPRVTLWGGARRVSMRSRSFHRRQRASVAVPPAGQRSGAGTSRGLGTRRLCRKTRHQSWSPSSARPDRCGLQMLEARVGTIVETMSRADKSETTASDWSYGPSANRGVARHCRRPTQTSAADGVDSADSSASAGVVASEQEKWAKLGEAIW